MAWHQRSNFTDLDVMHQLDLALSEHFGLTELKRPFGYLRLLRRQVRLHPISAAEMNIAGCFLVRGFIYRAFICLMNARSRRSHSIWRVRTVIIFDLTQQEKIPYSKSICTMRSLVCDNLLDLRSCGLVMRHQMYNLALKSGPMTSFCPKSQIILIRLFWSEFYSKSGLGSWCDLPREISKDILVRTTRFWSEPRRLTADFERNRHSPIRQLQHRV